MLTFRKEDAAFRKVKPINPPMYIEGGGRSWSVHDTLHTIPSRELHRVKWWNGIGRKGASGDYLQEWSTFIGERLVLKFVCGTGSIIIRKDINLKSSRQKSSSRRVIINEESVCVSTAFSFYFCILKILDRTNIINFKVRRIETVTAKEKSSAS